MNTLMFESKEERMLLASSRCWGASRKRTTVTERYVAGMRGGGHKVGSAVSVTDGGRNQYFLPDFLEANGFGHRAQHAKNVHLAIFASLRHQPIAAARRRRYAIRDTIDTIVDKREIPCRLNQMPM